MPDPIVESVKQKHDQRAERGLSKYGVNMTRRDLSTLDWLIHAQEEAMDLAVYLERIIKDESERCPPQPVDLGCANSWSDPADVPPELQTCRSKGHKPLEMLTGRASNLTFWSCPICNITWRVDSSG